MGNNEKEGGKSFPEEGTVSIEVMWRNPTWCIRETRRKKKKVEVEPREQGERWGYKGREILWRAIKAKLRHLDLLLSVMEANEGKD